MSPLALRAILIAFCLACPAAAQADGTWRQPSPPATLPPPPVGALPWIVAHRAGTADAPENTLPAIQSSLRHGVDAVWLSVQVSADGVPVLYRPQDLSALTEGQGSVASLPLAQLRRLNAGWRFVDRYGHHPYRSRPARIPTLAEALREIPPQIPVMLDLKTAPSQAVVAAVAQVLSDANQWPRVLLYSTEAGFASLWSRYPSARQFETRQDTRDRLLDIALAQRCKAPPQRQGWAAFELRRDLEISERFTLGEGRSKIAGASLWSAAAMRCYRREAPRYGLLWIGVASEEDFLLAWQRGASAVMVDSPEQARAWRAAAWKLLRLNAPAAR